jgi:hypothetical protein
MLVQLQGEATDRILLCRLVTPFSVSTSPEFILTVSSTVSCLSRLQTD